VFGAPGWEIIRKPKTQVYKPNLGHPKLSHHLLARATRH
jgi:hypothetical protein